MTLRNTAHAERTPLGNSIVVENLDVKSRQFLRRLFPAFARIALFVVYTWFGLIKFLGLSPATPLAAALTEQTIGSEYFTVSFAITAGYEVVLGVLFLIPAATRVALPLLLVHMGIVCSPLLLVPDLAWTAPLVPSMEGQYIIKNLAIVALATGLIAHFRPVVRK